MEGLRPMILDKIYALEKIPTMITKWYTEATQIDNQLHCSQEIKMQPRNQSKEQRDDAPETNKV